MAWCYLTTSFCFHRDFPKTLASACISVPRTAQGLMLLSFIKTVPIAALLYQLAYLCLQHLILHVQFRDDVNCWAFSMKINYLWWINSDNFSSLPSTHFTPCKVMFGTNNNRSLHEDYYGAAQLVLRTPRKLWDMVEHRSEFFFL